MVEKKLTKAELRDLARRFDPVILAQDAGFTSLFKWQQDVLRSQSRQILMCCARQGGKTSCAGLLALHNCYYNPGSLTVLVSHTQAFASEMLHQNTLVFHRAIGNSEVELVSDPQHGCTFSNGSRIKCLSSNPKTTRGYAGTKLLIIDECGEVEDALYNTMLPLLIRTRGRIILLGTPKGRRGFFWREFDEGKGWDKFTATWRDCDLKEEDIEHWRESMGEAWARQEFECDFLADTDTAFNPDDIKKAFSNETIQPLFA